jgi:putative intracellular protease/amidase
MTEAKDHCFVLWADRFDEVAAVVFVAELRRAGLRVRLVGLPGPSFVGVHGLSLAPDLTLDEALAQTARLACLVAPCDAPALARAVNDPRLADLLDQAAALETPVFAGSDVLAAVAPGQVHVYSQGQGFFRQVRRLARQVSRQRTPGPPARLQLGWQGIKSIA